MSAKEVQEKLGFPVSTRQFRRYLAAELIPAKWVTKNKQGHFVFVGTLTDEQWQRLRLEIQDWREKRFQRGWSARPRKSKVQLNARDKSAAIVTIEGISMSFELWHRKMKDVIPTWDHAQLSRAFELLNPISKVVHDIWERGYAMEQAKTKPL